MAGVLQFTLGLEAQSFLRNIGLATGGILTLAGAGKLLGDAMQNVWSAIERGGALNDLSARTGESVRNLYQLQEAFSIVGIGADSVGPMLSRMQKAMSGVDESGQRTDKLFKAMGLDLEVLKKLDAPKQFEVLAGAMGKLDKNQAAGIASQIFGREGAGNFLQITRDFASFQQSFRDSSQAATVFARSAAAFDTIGDTLTTVKMKLGGLWAGVAAGAAPAIQAAFDFVNAFDFVKLGQNFGTLISGISQAFREGGLSEMIGDAFRLGFETVISFAPALFEKLGYFLIKAFETPMIYIQSAMEYALTNAAHTFANNKWFRGIVELLNPGAALALGVIGDSGRESFSEILGRNKETGVRFNLGTGEFGTSDINADADARLQEAKQAFGEKWSKFWEDIVSTALRGPQSKPGAAPKGGTVDLGDVTQKSARVNTTALEKIGLVIGNGRGGDAASETANNTRQTNVLIKGLPKAIAEAMPMNPPLTNI